MTTNNFNKNNDATCRSDGRADVNRANTTASSDIRPPTASIPVVKERLAFEEVRITSETPLADLGISPDRQAVRRGRIIW